MVQGGVGDKGKRWFCQKQGNTTRTQKTQKSKNGDTVPPRRQRDPVYKATVKAYLGAWDDGEGKARQTVYGLKQTNRFRPGKSFEGLAELLSKNDPWWVVDKPSDVEIIALAPAEVDPRFKLNAKLSETGERQGSGRQPNIRLRSRDCPKGSP